MSLTAEAPDREVPSSVRETQEKDDFLDFLQWEGTFGL